MTIKLKCLNARVGQALNCIEELTFAAIELIGVNCPWTQAEDWYSKWKSPVFGLVSENERISAPENAEVQLLLAILHVPLVSCITQGPAWTMRIYVSEDLAVERHYCSNAELHQLRGGLIVGPADASMKGTCCCARGSNKNRSIGLGSGCV